jgi:NAD(P)-dependent dehydrogenase (short-subunit alcohol dehydrogenase family)
MQGRRAFLAGAALAATVAAVEGCARAESGPGSRPPGVPLSPFGAKSTAEEVTAGLDLAGKTVLVTGANTGLGHETLRVLALRGATVIGTARTLPKSREACAGVPGRTIPLALELDRFDTIVAASDAVHALGVPLDVLICNAGIMALPEPEQVYGLEKQYVVNHLGHFLLVNRLLDLVQAAPQGRVVVVSSSGYQWAPAAGIEFDNLAGTRDYAPNRMYGQSKLANGLFSRELARRLAGTRATSNSVHPGIINTELGRYFPAWKRKLAPLVGWAFMKSIPAGAATTCYVATAPALAHVSGCYFENCNPVVPGGQMQNDALAAKLWSVSEAETRPWLS